MSLLHKLTCRRSLNLSLVAAALSAPIAAFMGRAALAQNKLDTEVPGATVGTHSHMLHTAADLNQAKRPIDAMSEFLNGFHFYADDMGRQVEASHFCTHLTEDLHQCVIYDSNRLNAKLIGIEYIITERVFRSLSDEEKRLWHSHNYEVKSGELIAPGVGETAEHSVMKALVTTYGKTWHTWQIDRYPNLPTGIPQLMMGFTKDGQVKPQLVEDRDKRFGTNTHMLRRDRDDIAWPIIEPGANAWQSGTTVQLVLQEFPVKNLRL